VVEVATWVLGLGQVVWEQQRDSGAVCIVGITPFLLGAAVIGLRSIRRPQPR
jgi:hypothetical protein